MLSLSKFVSSGLFLKDLDIKNKFDVIIFEKEVPDQIDKSKYNCISLLEIGLDLTPEGVITSFLGDYEHPLRIMDELPIDTFFQVLDEYFGNITIINCNTGLSSYYSKTNPETQDITFANELNMTIREAFDVLSLEKIIKTTDKKSYLRLSDKEYPKFLLEKEVYEKVEQKTKEKTSNPHFFSMIDLTSQKDEDVKYTILSAGSTLPETVQTAKILQEEHNIPSDIFLITKRNGERTQSFKLHCKKTSNLIIICDQKMSEDLKMFFEIQKKQSDLKNISLNIICPNLEKSSTVLQDYIYEQTEFDANGIVSNILQNI